MTPSYFSPSQGGENFQFHKASSAMEPLFANLSTHPKLLVAMSQKSDGTMTTGGEAAREKEVKENRAKFFQAVGVSAAAVVQPRQAHGTRVVVVQHHRHPDAEADALITHEHGLFLSVTVADCLPIFLYDPSVKAVGLIHGGWRSLAQSILTATIERMVEKYKCQPGKILAGIGPGISRCHFVVDEEVAKKFQSYAALEVVEGGKLHLDLKEVAVQQLVASSVRREHIEINPDCTACRPEKYFSFRRDHPAVVSAMVAVIGMR